MDNNAIVVITGGFDPLHSGHIAYIKAANQIGRVFVGLNSDEWLVRKKGAAFMSISERLNIMSNLKDVMMAVPIDDSDGTAKDAIRQAREWFPRNKIIFANGGDRTSDNIPEMDIEDDNVEFRFGVGGEDKKNSSSWLLSEWKAPKTLRPWGYYRILHTDGPGIKVKELTINPGKSISLQRHRFRHEFWHVTEGACAVEQQMPSGYVLPTRDLTLHQQISIPVGDWHRVYNPYDVPCRIVEIQYGVQCVESDIERQ